MAIPAYLMDEILDKRIDQLENRIKNLEDQFKNRIKIL
jgi:hypothetical protein